MQDFRNLKVWEKAHAFTLDVYRVTASFPREERFALVDQLRRSASSIPTNIAEGCGRETDRDFAQFINIAAGSASECEYQLLLQTTSAISTRRLTASSTSASTRSSACLTCWAGS